jgi:3-dehydroquinate synthase
LKEIHVALGARSYSIYISRNLIQKISELLPSDGKKALITTANIYELYGERVSASIENYEVLLVPDGEEAKQINVVEEVVGELIDSKLDRKSTLIALGGGSVGDLSGFIASIYLRGINLVQIPTTLLAMVDSSIGGKNAINHLKGKNLIGSFYQPKMVLIDPIFLETLSELEIRSGLAEVIKYGIISDPYLFELLESREPWGLSENDMIEIITRCASIKAHYVEQDENDCKGIRAALNLGHTLGHAIETLSGHVVKHGEGVALGILMACIIARRDLLLSDLDYHRIWDLVEKYELPTKIPFLDHSEIIEVMHRDKKAEKGLVRFILPTGIGRTPITKSVNNELLIKVLEELS